MAYKPYRGHYKPINPGKWIITESGLSSKGIPEYRSGWERKFMVWADRNPRVLEVSSEPFAIPYISPVDHKQHRYYIDFYVKVEAPDGSISQKAIEVKPMKETKPPRKSKNKLQYAKAVKTYVVNQAKWKAAKLFCDKQGWDFVILTEKELGI